MTRANLGLIAFYSLFVVSPLAAADWTDVQKARFRSARTLRVVLTSQGDATHWRKSVSDAVSDLFSSCKLKVVETDATMADVTLHISMNGQSLRANYGSAGYRWTGASVRGTVRVSLNEAFVLEREFAGRLAPPRLITYYGSGFAARKDARMDKALVADGSLMPALLRIVADVYGVDGVLGATGHLTIMTRHAGGGATGIGMGPGKQVKLLVDMCKENPAVLIPYIHGQSYISQSEIAARALISISKGGVAENEQVEHMLDRSWMICDLADSFRNLGDRRSVPILIRMLDWVYSSTAGEKSATKAKIMASILNALKTITGQNLDDPAKWKAWWETNKSQFLEAP